MKTLILPLFFTLLTHSALLAQINSYGVPVDDKSCKIALEEAQQFLDLHRTNDVIDIFKKCPPDLWLNEPGQKLRAYRLLTIAQLQQNELNQAEEAANNLLNINSDYDPTTAPNPDNFIELIERLKKERREREQARTQYKKRRLRYWLIGGAAILTAGVATTVILTQDEPVKNLPTPPGPPND